MILGFDSIGSFSHDFTFTTPLIIGNGPTPTNFIELLLISGARQNSKATLSSQILITAESTAASIKVYFFRGLPKPNEILKCDTMPGFEPVISLSQ